MRELWETIVDLADALTDDGNTLVRVTALEMDLPLEVVLHGTGFMAELPRWRISTGFDPPRSRLQLKVEVERG